MRREALLPSPRNVVGAACVSALCHLDCMEREIASADLAWGDSSAGLASDGDAEADGQRVAPLAAAR